MSCLGNVPLILGHTWLKKHNPDVDWTTGAVKLNRCPPECKTLLETHFAKLLHQNETQETWVQALKAYKSKVMVDESTLEDAQKLVPKEYWEYLNVFSERCSVQVIRSETLAKVGLASTGRHTQTSHGQVTQKM